MSKAREFKSWWNDQRMPGFPGQGTCPKCGKRNWDWLVLKEDKGKVVPVRCDKCPPRGMHH
jgi:hypothetical protein